jgi:hypothetical protein
VGTILCERDKIIAPHRIAITYRSVPLVQAGHLDRGGQLQEAGVVPTERQSVDGGSSILIVLLLILVVDEFTTTTNGACFFQS